MQKFIHYLLAPLFYFIVARVGVFFTAQGVTSWYPTIARPSYTPPGSFIGIMWTVIFILSAVSLILCINTTRRKSNFWSLIGLYVVNGIFNASWSYIFFVRHEFGLAVISAILIWTTVAVLIVVLWSSSRMASLLLLPYFLWVSFATYVTYAIYTMN